MRKVAFALLLLWVSISAKPQTVFVGGFSLSDSSAPRGGVVTAQWSVVNTGPDTTVRTFLELLYAQPCPVSGCLVFPLTTATGEYWIQRGERIDLTGDWIVAAIGTTGGELLPVEPNSGTYRIRAAVQRVRRNGSADGPISTPEVFFTILD